MTWGSQWSTGMGRNAVFGNWSGGCQRQKECKWIRSPFHPLPSPRKQWYHRCNCALLLKIPAKGSGLPDFLFSNGNAEQKNKWKRSNSCRDWALKMLKDADFIRSLQGVPLQEEEGILSCKTKLLPCKMVCWVHRNFPGPGIFLTVDGNSMRLHR